MDQEKFDKLTGDASEKLMMALLPDGTVADYLGVLSQQATDIAVSVRRMANWGADPQMVQSAGGQLFVYLTTLGNEFELKPYDYIIIIASVLKQLTETLAESGGDVFIKEIIEKISEQ